MPPNELLAQINELIPTALDGDVVDRPTTPSPPTRSSLRPGIQRSKQRSISLEAGRLYDLVVTCVFVIPFEQTFRFRRNPRLLVVVASKLLDRFE
jgi:hypothetical protein